MKKFLFSALACATFGASFAQTVLFADGFESTALGAEPDPSLWNNGVTGNATDLATIIDAAGGQVHAGAQALSVPVAPSGRRRYYANLTPAVVGATDVAVLDYWVYDSYSTANSGNARQFVQMTDYTIDYDRASGLQQLVAIGNWNAENAFNLGPYNDGYVGATPSLGTYYHGRILSANAGFGLPGAGNNTINWFSLGFAADKRRSTGWHNMKLVYGAGWAEFYVDGIRGFYYQHGRDASFDQLTLPPNESTTIPAYYDNIVVKAYPWSTISFTVNLQDYLGDATQIPLQVELRASGGGVTTVNTFMDQYGSVMVTPPGNGTYDVWVKGSHWLGKVASGVVVDNIGSHGLTFSLLNGDVDNDNEVGPGDFSELSGAFGSDPSASNWNPNADLDGDEEVGPNDFSILSANFGQSGD